MKDINNDPFSEYIKNLPPGRRELGQAWSTAIGLQDVDGLKPSEYLYETAKKSIDGELSIDEVGEHINSYYESKGVCPDRDARTEEADKVSARIAKLLSDILISRQHSTSQFTENYLQAYILMPEKFVIIISQKKNGCSMVIPFHMQDH